jgi:hypothetical protein
MVFHVSAVRVFWSMNSCLEARPNEYSLFEIPTSLVQQCMEATARAILLAAWLAALARRENSRFKEFIAWLRFGEFQ